MAREPDTPPPRPVHRRPLRGHPGGLLRGRSDRQLLADHLAGDPRAFGELARRHSDRLWRAARAILSDPEIAGDALQNALLRAFRLADSFRGDAQVVTWLHTIVTRTALDEVASRSRHQAEDFDDHAAALFPHRRSDAEDWADQEVVCAVVRDLPADQRECFVRIDLLGFSYAEVAAELELAEGTVKSRRARAKTRLIAALREAGLIGSEHTESSAARDR